MRRDARQDLALLVLVALHWSACGRLVDYQDCPEGECRVACNQDDDCPSQLPRCANGACAAACADLDADGHCAAVDCDDDSSSCGLDCRDDDQDGTPDCRDACLDGDGDNVCSPLDCDDDPETGVACSTTCITGHLDRDNDGRGGAETRRVCVLGPGLAMTSDDCADLPGADPACGGLDGARCSPNNVEVCGDGADNDCNGAADCAESACVGSPCDDGLFCTVTDVCTQGACAGTDDPCGPPSDANCIACDEERDACTANEAAGSACDDGVLCNGFDTCNASGACANHAGDPCSTAACSGVCNETLQTCSNVSAGNCFLSGACYASGERNPNNTCQECDPSVSQTLWTNRSGSCDDGALCTHSDACSSTGVCVGTAITCTSDSGACALQRVCNGTAACATSYPGNTATCNDGVACTHTDRCDGSGGCRGTAIPCDSDPGPCGAQRSCNGITCSVSYPGASTSCSTGAACATQTCNGSGSCLATVNPGSCLIADTCYANGARNPANPCQECDAGVSQTTWTNRMGSCGPGGDGNDCTHSDTCVGGSCTGTPYTCTDNDGLTCTVTPSCNGAGGCDYAIAAATCLIGGACYANEARHPTNPCQECKSANNTVWSNRTGSCATPGDGDACTHTDTCNAGVCLGTAYTCVDSDGLSCTVNPTCNGAGGCTYSIAASTCLISSACYANGDARPGNVCERCTSSASQTTWSASSASCDDGTYCNGSDTCSGGSCSQHDFNPCPNQQYPTCVEDTDDCCHLTWNSVCEVQDGPYCVDPASPQCIGARAHNTGVSCGGTYTNFYCFYPGHANCAGTCILD